MQHDLPLSISPTKSQCGSDRQGHRLKELRAYSILVQSLSGHFCCPTCILTYSTTWSSTRFCTSSHHTKSMHGLHRWLHLTLLCVLDKTRVSIGEGLLPWLSAALLPMHDLLSTSTKHCMNALKSLKVLVLSPSGLSTVAEISPLRHR